MAIRKKYKDDFEKKHGIRLGTDTKYLVYILENSRHGVRRHTRSLRTQDPIRVHRKCRPLVTAHVVHANVSTILGVCLSLTCDLCL